MNFTTKFRHWLREKPPLFALVSGALLFAGCGPEEFVVWAPDGQHAFVSAQDGTLIDSAGNQLGAALGEHEKALAWLPDSRHLLIVRHVPAQNWQEYAQLLDAERTQFIVQTAGEVAGLIGSYHGDWRKFGSSPAVKAWKDNLDSRGEEVSNVAFYLQQTRPQALAPLIEASRQIAEASAQGTSSEDTDTIFSEEKSIAYIAELRIRQTVPLNPAADRLLLRSPDSIPWSAASPSGRAIAFVRNEPGYDRLYVLTSQAGAQPVLVDAGTDFAAWSPDGQYLAYAKATVPRPQELGNMQLGSIARRHVCGPTGDVLAEMEASEDLAGLILPGRPARVAWLPDGRILFASAAFTLPVTTDELPKDLTLFALRLQPTPTVERLIPANAQALLPDRVDLFTVSPDGKKVALCGKTGAVSVFVLETGALVQLQAEIPKVFDDSNNDAMVPTWRNADELCYVVAPGDPAGSAERAEVVIGSLAGSKRAISKSWPAARFLPAKGATP
jgi:dipeptidyl aminopeptidase/acylaminoacyl peptidase